MMQTRRQTRLTFVGLAAILLLLGGIASIAVSPVAYAAKPTSLPDPKGKAKGHDPLIDKGAVVNITATGTAFKISNQSITDTARVTFKATVEKSSRGSAKLNVTQGQLKIDNVVYTIEKGKGRLLHNGKLIVHLQVVAPDGSKLHVVLKGKYTGILPTVGNSIPVAFTKPQSKLADKFFLDLTATGSLKRLS